MSFYKLLFSNLNLASARRNLRMDEINVVFINQNTQEDDTMFLERALNTILRWQICFAAAVLICYVLRIN